MRAQISAPELIFLGLSVALAVPCANADEPCATFTWDVSHERALFSQNATLLAAGKTLGASPAMTPDRLYQLQLKEKSDLTFAVPPERNKPNETTYAGLATLSVEATGVYRIALDQGLWVDAIVNGSLVRAEDFQGRRGCNAPHKIVEFLLPARTQITLQFSASNVPIVKVSVTRSPAKAL
jgi:hypothetical protein